jgi:hypothetical protein
MLQGDQIGEDEMVGHVARMGDLKERDYLEYQDVDGRIILK